MSYQIRGFVYKVDELQMVGTNYKRNVIVYVRNERNEQYSDYLTVEFFGEDKMAMVSSLQPKQEVIVDFDLRGRKAMRKDGSGECFFVTLSGWRIQPANAVAQQQVQQQQTFQTMIQQNPAVAQMAQQFCQPVQQSNPTFNQPAGDLPF